MIWVLDDFLPDRVCVGLRKFALYPPSKYQNIYTDYKSLNFDITRKDVSKFSMLNVVDNYVLPKLDRWGKLLYNRSWCFVYDNQSSGVPAHADPSYLNVNVWITPDNCINDPDKNGLKIYHKQPDDNVSWADYNSNRAFIDSQIKDSEYTVIPHKYNRAVVFYGKMYHETTGVDMKPGHNNKRVNYTFLFNK